MLRNCKHLGRRGDRLVGDRDGLRPELGRNVGAFGERDEKQRGLEKLHDRSKRHGLIVASGPHHKVPGAAVMWISQIGLEWRRWYAFIYRQKGGRLLSQILRTRFFFRNEFTKMSRVRRLQFWPSELSCPYTLASASESPAQAGFVLYEALDVCDERLIYLFRHRLDLPDEPLSIPCSQLQQKGVILDALQGEAIAEASVAQLGR